MADPTPTRAVVTELGSDNRLPASPPPAPTDYLHVHPRRERLLIVLEQQGFDVGDDLHHIRHTP